MPFEESSGAFQDAFPIDKLIHFSMFAVFGLLWMRVGSAGGRRGKVLAGGIILAVVTELGQLIPVLGRDAGLLDALADTGGLIAGIVAAGWMAQKWARRSREDAET